MIDQYDASHDRLRFAVAMAFKSYSEDTLLDALCDADPIVRTTAARELHVRGGPNVFDAAVKLTQHPRFDFREIGAFVLGQLGTPTCPFATMSMTPLATLLSDTYHEVRASAVGALGFLASLGHQPSNGIVAQMIATCKDAEPSVRTAAALSMGMVHAKSARDVLTTMIHDRDARVRDCVHFGLELHADRKPKSKCKARQSSHEPA